MRVTRVFGFHRKTPVVVLDVARQPCVGAVPVVDARQPHFLDQPILQGLICALHTPLGLWAVSRDAFNTQFTRGTRELGFSLRIGIPGIDVEDAVSIAVKRRWRAVRPYVIVQYPACSPA